MIRHARLPHGGTSGSSLLRVIPRLPHKLRVARTIPTILINRTRRDMLRVATDPTIDPDMALIIAIIELMVQDTGVGLEA